MQCISFVSLKRQKVPGSMSVKICWAGDWEAIFPTLVGGTSLSVAPIEGEIDASATNET